MTLARLIGFRRPLGRRLLKSASSLPEVFENGASTDFVLAYPVTVISMSSLAPEGFLLFKIFLVVRKFEEGI